MYTGGILMTTALKLLKARMQVPKRNRNFTKATQVSPATTEEITNYKLAEKNYNDYISKQK